MANTLYIGVQATGNDLYIWGLQPSSGLAYGTSTVLGVVVPVGLVYGTSNVEGAGLALAEATGGVQGSVEVVGQMLSNRGDGSAAGSAAAIADNTLMFAYSDGVATVEGEGLSHSEFAPFFMWPNFSTDTASITIPIADLAGDLDATEADPVTGDWRKILQAFMQQMEAHYSTLEEQAEGPPRTTRSHIVTNYSAKHPVFGTTLRRTTLAHFYLDYQTGNVAQEP